MRADFLSTATANRVRAKLDTSSPKLILQLLASNWPDLILLLGLALIFLPNSLQLAVSVLVGFLVVREAVQMAVSVKRYFSSLENWIEMAMISLVITILFYNTEENVGLP